MPAEIKYPYQVIELFNELLGEHWWEEQGSKIVHEGIWNAVRTDGGLTNANAVAAHVSGSFRQALMERMEYTDDFALQGRFFVNEYLTNEQYGGPEEGGWWYSVGHFVQCHGDFATRKEADAQVESMSDYLKGLRESQFPPTSVSCNGWSELRVQVSPGGDFPTHRPMYE